VVIAQLQQLTLVQQRTVTDEGLAGSLENHEVLKALTDLLSGIP
jgi:hypothetical protein